MRVLIIGGNRFVGFQCTGRLLQRGDRVTLFNRGNRKDPFGEKVERIKGDRTSGDFARLLGGREFEAVIDFAAYTEADARGVIEVFAGRVGHYVFISTGQVYLVREGCPKPARESDYAGAVMAEPADAIERDEWLYGMGKRGAEDALAEAFATSGFPCTSLRIPMVNGNGDYYRRIESYLRRMMDGGPVLLPEGGEVLCRHVYAPDVAATICGWLARKETFGRAFNLCQDEQPTLRDMMEMIARLANRRVEIRAISSERLARAGLRAKDISPFSNPWMSRLDPELARREMGFVHTPLAEYLETIVGNYMDLWDLRGDPPANYANRKVELELARELTE
jgi:nucleoside-diphosphate-sugar epimerase